VRDGVGVVAGAGAGEGWVLGQGKARQGGLRKGLLRLFSVVVLSDFSVVLSFLYSNHSSACR
jgi:hypothetical protein